MTIAEVSSAYDISADTLRYYERVGLLPSIGRTSGGIRNYSEEDCRWVEYIKCMRSAGVSVTIQALKFLLLELLAQISDWIDGLQAVLAWLDWIFDGYEERMVKCEENLR